MTGDLTARQRRILNFIHATVRERGYPPTVREIGQAVGLTSSSSVHSQLANLERRGLLRRDPTKPRAIELHGPGAPTANAVNLPLLGSVAAGPALLADEQVEDYVAVPTGLAPGGPGHFVLRVQGDSMVGAGILDGDMVVVRVQDAAEDGDVVVALLPGPAEGEATIKRLDHRDGRTILVPENPAMPPFELPDEGSILGKVVGLLRSL